MLARPLVETCATLFNKWWLMIFIYISTIGIVPSVPAEETWMVVDDLYLYKHYSYHVFVGE